MAGSGIRGQFEEKFKALIRDIEEQVNHSLFLIFSKTRLDVLFVEWTSHLLH